MNPATIQEYLEGVDYPVSKGELVKVAQDRGASTDIIDMLESMPGDTFGSPTDISKAIGTMR